MKPSPPPPAVVSHDLEIKDAQLIFNRVCKELEQEFGRNRYRTFKEKTYDALVSLKQISHYHFINAQAPIEVVQQNIILVREYQSSLELDPRTSDTLRHIPLADEIVQSARQELVNRLFGFIAAIKM